MDAEERAAKTKISMTEKIHKMRDSQKKQTSIRVKLANSQKAASMSGSMKTRDGGIIKDKRLQQLKMLKGSKVGFDDKGYNSVVEPTTEELRETLMQKFN